jgi:hypothetical protein
MKVLLTNRQTDAEKLITVPSGLDFRGFIAAVRSHEPSRLWEISESWDPDEDLADEDYPQFNAA